MAPARIIKFPGNPRPRERRVEPALILILPVTRIDYEDSLRAARREAYYRMKRALARNPVLPFGF